MSLNNLFKCIPELIQRILGFVVSEFHEVYNLGFINHYCKDVLHGQFGMTLTNKMGLKIMHNIVTTEYKLPYTDFITVLGANNGIIAGGFVLSCITKRFYETQDIDIYLRSKIEAEEIGRFLRMRGYKLKRLYQIDDQYDISGTQEQQYTTIGGCYISEIHNYYRRISKNRNIFKCIQLIILKNKHDRPSMVIYKFDITLCQISIIFTVNRNGRIASRFLIVHPGDIVNEVIIINPLFKTNICNLRCLYSIYGNFSDQIRDNIRSTIHQRILKYREKGFILCSGCNYYAVIDDLFT
jgi:hypothetical protein